MLEIKKNIVLTKTGAKPVLIDLFYKKKISKMPVIIFCHGYKGYKDWGAWNLVAKEFVATRTKKDGVLILSEMAGAAKELFDAVTVNPFDLNSMADSIYQAINMPLNEQKRRNSTMQNRLKRYDVKHWASEFYKALKIKSDEKNISSSKKIGPARFLKIKNQKNKKKLTI